MKERKKANKSPIEAMTKNSYAIKKIFGKIGRQPKKISVFYRRNTLKKNSN